MGHTVLVTDHAFDDLSIERELLADIDATVVDGETADAPLSDLVVDADALIVMYEEIEADLLARAPNLQVVSRTGIGFDNVDVEEATAREIVVTNVPDYCIEEVSDHTIALLLALQRKIVPYNEATHAGEWDVAAGREMHRIEGRTIGLIAFGNIAQAVGRKAHGLGMDVVAWDPYLDDSDIETGGATPVDDLTDLLEASDVVSVHPPLTPDTRGMIDTAELRTMKPTSFLLNVARGGIVDEEALGEALESNEIAGAGLDVLETEPPAGDHPLRGRDDVILTPHAAWNSVESLVELREKAAKNARAVLAGERPPYVVNAELYE